LLSSQSLLYVPLPNFSAIYGFSYAAGTLAAVASSASNPFLVSGGVETIAADPAGKFLYVPNPSFNTVTVVAIQSGGTLAAGPGAFATQTAPVAATTDASGTYLYVANSGSTSLSQYKIDSSSGSLTALSTATVSAGASPSFFLLDPDGSFLFVGNRGASSISEYTVQSGGTLASTGNTLRPGFQPRSLAVTR
jgi:6-phosphogluconolactonase (cycloisomerase 2 family)